MATIRREFFDDLHSNTEEELVKVIRGYGVSDWSMENGRQQANGDGKGRNMSVSTKMGWNHKITGFRVGNDGNVYVNYYWQGDDTDGEDSVLYEKAKRGVTIPAESYFDGYRTRYQHGDIRITREELVDAVKKVGEQVGGKPALDEKGFVRKDSTQQNKKPKSSRVQSVAKKTSRGRVHG